MGEVAAVVEGEGRVGVGEAGGDELADGLGSLDCKMFVEENWGMIC